jgi:hypothetical protein
MRLGVFASEGLCMWPIKGPDAQSTRSNSILVIGENNGTNLEVNDFLLLVQIDCIGTARLLTLPALFMVEIEAMVLVNGVTGRNSLCIGSVDALNRI